MQAAAANPFMGMGDLTQPISASPARPPPPTIPPQPKSAFDDLEDVMRMSLGGSPAKSQQPITQQPQPMAAQPFSDVMSMPMAQPMMFGSPARQPMMPMGATGSIFKHLNGPFFIVVFFFNSLQSCQLIIVVCAFY